MKPKKPAAPDQRSVTIGTQSFDAMWGEFIARNSCSTEVLRPEDGWRTTQQIAQQMGVTKTTADHHLANALASGKMERRLSRSNGRRAYFWRPCASASK